MKKFCETYKLRNVLKEPTCFKNPDNPPACIEIETGLSHFHKMIQIWLKMHFTIMKPQVIRYWIYKDFHNETILDSLRHELNIQGRFLNERGLDAFAAICTEIFDKHTNKEISKT